MRPARCLLRYRGHIVNSEVRPPIPIENLNVWQPVNLRIKILITRPKRDLNPRP